MKVDMLTSQDIFDFYGSQFLATYPGIDADDVLVAELRIDEVYVKYLHAARERIKSECRFLGLEGFELSSIKKMLGMIKDMLENEIGKQAAKMGGMGTGFNMGKMIAQANQLAGRDIGDLGKQFGLQEPQEEVKKDSIDVDSLTKDSKWHIIAKAFLQLENAVTCKEKASAIDLLNGLQHNSFHLLIDLQTGRMQEEVAQDKTDHQEAVNIVKEVLDIKFEAATPLDFAAKMSGDIRKTLVRYRYLMKKPQ